MSDKEAGLESKRSCVMSVQISLSEWVPTVFWKLGLLEDKADSFKASFGEKVVKSSQLIKEKQRQHESETLNLLSKDLDILKTQIASVFNSNSKHLYLHREQHIYLQ